MCSLLPSRAPPQPTTPQSSPILRKMVRPSLEISEYETKTIAVVIWASWSPRLIYRHAHVFLVPMQSHHHVLRSRDLQLINACLTLGGAAVCSKPHDSYLFSAWRFQNFWRFCFLYRFSNISRRSFPVQSCRILSPCSFYLCLAQKSIVSFSLG